MRNSTRRLWPGVRLYEVKGGKGGGDRFKVTRFMDSLESRMVPGPWP